MVPQTKIGGHRPTLNSRLEVGVGKVGIKAYIIAKTGAKVAPGKGNFNADTR